MAEEATQDGCINTHKEEEERKKEVTYQEEEKTFTDTEGRKIWFKVQI